MKAIQFPPFFTPETLRIAIAEVDAANLTPDERMVAEMTLSNNAIAMWQEIERRDKAIADYKAKERKECIKRALELDIDVNIIGHLYDVSIDFINEVASEID